MRIKVKETLCPLCAGELVIDDGNITCIDNCDIGHVEFSSETMTKLQPVIDWQGRQTDQGRSMAEDAVN